MININQKSINLIVATSANWGIGKDNKLLVSIKEDMMFFKRMTMNNIVVMGRKTQESLPNHKYLKSRINVIITSKNKENEIIDENTQIIYFNSIEKFLSKKENIPGYDNKEIFIIGGSSIYTEFINSKIVDKLYVTKFKKDMDADVFIPNLYKNYVETRFIIPWTIDKETKIEYCIILMEPIS